MSRNITALVLILILVAVVRSWERTRLSSASSSARGQAAMTSTPSPSGAEDSQRLAATAAIEEPSIHGVKLGDRADCIQGSGKPHHTSFGDPMCLPRFEARCYGRDGTTPYVGLQSDRVGDVEGRSVEFSGGERICYGYSQREVEAIMGAPASLRAFQGRGFTEAYYPQWNLAMRYRDGRFARAWLQTNLRKSLSIPEKDRPFTPRPLSEWYGPPEAMVR